MNNNRNNMKDMSDTTKRRHSLKDENCESSIFSTVMTCITDNALDNFRLFMENLNVTLKYHNGESYKKIWDKIEQSEVDEQLDTTIKNTLGESEKTKQAPPKSEPTRVDNPHVCRLCGHTQPEGWQHTTCYYNMINIHNVCQTQTLKPTFQSEEHNPDKCEECITIKKYKIANSQMLKSQPQEYYFDKQGKNANLVKAGKDPHRRYNGVIIRDNVISELDLTENDYIDTFKLDEEADDPEQISRVKLHSKGVTENGQDLGTETVEEAIGIRNPTEDRIFVNGPKSRNTVDDFHKYIETGGVEGDVPVLNANYEDNKTELDRTNAITIEYELSSEDPIGAVWTTDAEKIWKVGERSTLKQNGKRKRGILINNFQTEKVDTTVCDCVSERQSYNMPMKVNIFGGPEHVDIGSQYDFTIETGPRLTYSPKTWRNKYGKDVTTNSLDDKCGTCGKYIKYEEQTNNINEYLKAGNTLPYGLNKIEAASTSILPPTIKTFVGTVAVQMLMKQRKLRSTIESLTSQNVFGEDQTTTTTNNKLKKLSTDHWNIAPLITYGGELEILQNTPDDVRTEMVVQINKAKILKREGGKLNYQKAYEIEDAVRRNLAALNTTQSVKVETIQETIVDSCGLTPPQTSDYGSGPEAARSASAISGHGLITKHHAIKVWKEYQKSTEWQSSDDIKLDASYWKNWRNTTRKMTQMNCKFGIHTNNPIIVGVVGTSKIPSSMKARFRDVIGKTLESLQAKHGQSMIVLSGGAKGVDEMAVKKAKSLQIPTIEFKPENQSWDEGYKARNKLIALHSHHLLDFVLKKGVYLKCPPPDKETGEFAKCEACTKTGKTFCNHTWTETKYDEDCQHCIENNSYKNGKKINHCKSGGCYTAWVAKQYGCSNVNVITCDSKTETSEVIA